jgi:hypothetical protein
MMEIVVKITKADIKNGAFCNQSSPEALALKRTLKENGVHILDAGVSDSVNRRKSGSIWAEVFYATPTDNENSAKFNVYKAFLDKKNPHLFDWVKTFNTCVGPSYVNGIYHHSVTHNPKIKKSDLPEIEFTIDIPPRVLKHSEYTKWVNDNIFCEGGCILGGTFHRVWTLGRSGGIYDGIRDNSYMSFLVRKVREINDQSYVDELPWGAYACYNHSQENVMFFNKRFKKSKSFDDGRHFIPTVEFKISSEEFEDTLRRLKRKYGRKKNLSVVVPIRTINTSLDYIDAGICVAYDED